MTVGQRLRIARKRLKKNQSDIAEVLGCTQAAISEWESDKSVPRLTDVRAIASAYGINPHLLIPGGKGA